MPVRSFNVVTENAHVRLIERGALKVVWYAAMRFKATVAEIAERIKIGSKPSLP
jgi:hypothetical protein